MIKCTRIAHATLTVTDIHVTKKFYETLFDVTLKMDNKYSFSLLAVGVPIWFVQWHKASKDIFDEKRVGLDHIAMEVADVSELEKAAVKLTQMKVPFAGLQKFAGMYPYIAFRDPDNIQTEFFISREVK